MGDALREAWLWLILAFIIGVIVGYFLRKFTVRERTTTESTSSSSGSAVEPINAAPAAAKPAAVAAAAKPATAKAPAVKPAAAKAPAKKPAAAKPAAALDLAAAKAAIGTSVKLDDLKLIEGIGPKIEGLMKADGITTWAELSKANVERLRGILDNAGPRYNIHDPGSWPKQARLLAAGKWDEFVTLTDSLKGGR